MKTMYKIVLREGNRLKTLFHSIMGSRYLPYNIWLKAEKKFGKDGSNQKPYLTGIHCFEDKDFASTYLKRFKSEKDRIIIKCEAKCLRRKPSNKHVFLADEIKIIGSGFKWLEQYF